MMDLKKIAYAALALGASICVVGCAAAQSASYPTRPIKVIVPYAAGGNGDVVARILGEKASADLGQPIIIDNRSGANGVTGAAVAAHAAPDGYSLLQIATTHVILPTLQQDLPYNWEKDFTPVFGTVSVPLVFAVNAKSNIRSMDDLAALAKSTSGGLNYASGGAGSISHLAAADLVQKLKISATHVPYRGFTPAVEALLGNDVHFICVTVSDVIELAKSGDVRLLAVTSEQRMSSLPDVPTMAELHFADFYPSSWNGYVAPANTPSDAIDRLYKAYGKAGSDPSVQDLLAKRGVMVKIRNGAEFGKFMSDESARWRHVIEENHIKMER
jgi:tripartite-type tricarboxylate transporter receptor subunit TctC